MPPCSESGIGCLIFSYSLSLQFPIASRAEQRWLKLCFIVSYTLYLFNNRFILSSLCLLSSFLPSSAMDYGRSGVYDSPMATDYYVKRFGFLFGGGRSGAAGLAALQVKHYLFPTKASLLHLENSSPELQGQPVGKLVQP